jgi:hypothetical protein
MFPITTIRNNIENSYPTMVFTHTCPIWAFIQYGEQPKEYHKIFV